MQAYHKWIGRILGIGVLAGLLIVFAQPTPQPLAVRFEHYADSTAQLGVEALSRLAQSNHFKPINNLRLGISPATHWLYFAYENDQVPKRFSLEISNHRINKVEVFEEINGQIRSLGLSGDKFPFAQRPSPHRTFVYPIELKPFVKARYYILLDKRHEDLSTSVDLWHSTHFEEKQQRSSLTWGIVSGIFLLFLIANLFFWRFTRDIIFGWYLGYVGALFLRTPVDTGVAFQYWWPTLPQLNQPDPLIPVLLTLSYFMLHFVALFTGQNIQNSHAFRVLRWYKWVLLGSIGLYWVLVATDVWQISGAYQWLLYAFGLLSFCTIAVLTWGVAERLFCTERDAILVPYAAVLMVQIIGYSLVVIQQQLSTADGSVYWVDPYLVSFINFILDLGIFSYGLAMRVKQAYIQNERLEVEFLTTQQEHNQRIIEALQSEREQITQILNDDVGNLLHTADKCLVHSQDAVPERSDLVVFARKLLRKSLSDLQSVALNLVPLEFAEKGLAHAVETATLHANRSEGLRFGFIQTGTVRRLRVEVQLYRMANELINNVLKHAEASQATTELRYEAQAITLIVQDNGKGFSPQHIPSSQAGIGVQNLYARANYLQADVSIDSDASGTSITVKIPLNTP
jgi:two-component system, sensor histidine kinase LadS